MAKVSEKNNNQQIVDFNKLRKRRQRFTTIKRLVILGCVVTLLLGAVFLNNLLVQENVTTRISDLVSGFGGSGYPVPLPGGVIKDVKSIGDNLAVLNDTNLYIYNAGGKQVANFQQMNDSTVLLASGNRLMTYDANGKKYAIHSRSKTLEEQTLDYAIITASMNDRGDYAVVSSAKQHICQINVYNKRFESIYSRSIAEDLVSTVSVSPRGNMMAAGWVNGRDGMLHSGVSVYRLSSYEDPVTFELPDNLVLDVQYLEEERIAVLTDTQYLILGSDARLKYSYDFGGRQIAAIERDGRQAMLLLEDKDSRLREVVLLDAELEEKAVYSTLDKVVDIQMASRRVYLLTEDTIVTYDHAFEMQNQEPVQHVNRIHLSGSRVYYLTREEIRVMGQAVAESSQEDTPEEDDFFLDDLDEPEGEPAENASEALSDTEDGAEEEQAGAAAADGEAVPEDGEAAQ